MDDQRTGGELSDITFDDDDSQSIDCFRAVLQRMGAKLKADEPWTPIGDVYRLIVGDETLTVVSDGWTGTVSALASAELIAKIVDAMNEKQKPTT